MSSCYCEVAWWIFSDSKRNQFHFSHSLVIRSFLITLLYVSRISIQQWHENSSKHDMTTFSFLFSSTNESNDSFSFGLPIKFHFVYSYKLSHYESLTLSSKSRSLLPREINFCHPHRMMSEGRASESWETTRNRNKQPVNSIINSIFFPSCTHFISSRSICNSTATERDVEWKLKDKFFLFMFRCH